MHHRRIHKREVAEILRRKKLGVHEIEGLGEHTRCIEHIPVPDIGAEHRL